MDDDLDTLYRSEALLALSSMEASLAALRAKPADAEASTRLAESAHTLGGIANIAGRTTIADFARRMEEAVATLEKPLSDNGRRDALAIFERAARAARSAVERPLEDEDPDDVPAEIHALSAQLERMPTDLEGRPKILVVDDSPTILRFVDRALSKAGFEVLSAKSEADAVAWLSRARPDLILLDLSLTSGCDESTLAGLTPNGARIPCPVLLFSNRSEADLQETATRSGAAGILRKDGNVATLVDAVRQWVDPSSSAREPRGQA